MMQKVIRCGLLVMAMTILGMTDIYCQSSISGTVIDATTQQPVIGATVIIPNTTMGVATDLDGKFTIQHLKTTHCSISVMMLGYETQTIENVKVGTEALSVALVPQSEEIDAVTVRTIKRLSNETGITQEIKSSKMVVSGLSSSSIAKSQDRDAGEAVRRIAGISVVDDKYIIARGLSQRYNNVWINNSSTPSSEADTRSFSFDVIPAGQIENILIIKSPIPELPADFSGGFVKINTKETPEEQPFSANVTIGYNSVAHGNDFLYSKGSGTDWLGYDNGYRMMQGGISAAYNNGDAAQVTKMTATGFNNDWNVNSKRPIPDMKANVSYGKSIELGNATKLNVNGALNYSYTSRSFLDMENSRYGVYNKAEDKPEYLYNYTDNQYTTSVKVGGLLNLAYIRRNSRYYWRNIFNQTGLDKYTERDGWQNISSLYIQKKAEYNYSSRTTYNGQLAAVYEFGDNRIDWRVGYSYANKNQPDRRIINRQQNDIYGDVNYGKLAVDQNDIERNFTKLNEHIASVGADYTLSREKFELKAGVFADYRKRDYRNRLFYYRYNQSNLPDDFAYGDVVNDMMVASNFAADKFYIYDDTDNRDSYDGTNKAAAAYIELNVPAGKWNIYAGARYEHSAMTLTNYTRINEWTSKDRDYIYDDVFPSANITYELNAKNLFRVAYGMSTNRPEFREVSSSVYYDFDLFSDVKGNPDLKAVYIQNVDLRYEWYPSTGETVSAALFYKYFKNPIEATFLDAGGSYTYTSENADSADAYGIELDIRKNLEFMGLKNVDFTFNGSLIDSKVFFADDSMEHDRPMQGQSPYLVNAGLYYNGARNGLTVSMMYNRIGKRIVGIGKVDTSAGGSIDNDIPDMYEMPRNSLDIVIGKKLGQHWEVKFSCKDVLSEDSIYCQFPKYTTADGTAQSRKQVTKRYNTGRNLMLSIGAKF